MSVTALEIQIWFVSFFVILKCKEKKLRMPLKAYHKFVIKNSNKQLSSGQ